MRDFSIQQLAAVFIALILFAQGVTLAQTYVPSGCPVLKGSFSCDMFTEQKPTFDSLCIADLPNNSPSYTSQSCADVASVLESINQTTSTAHPELKNAGLITCGGSFRGGEALLYARGCPSRMIASMPVCPTGMFSAFWANRQGYKVISAAQVDSIAKVPLLLFVGENDGICGNQDQYQLMQACRQRGGACTYFIVPKAEHVDVSTDARNFMFQWLRAVFRLRDPGTDPRTAMPVYNRIDVTKGWLGEVVLAPTPGYYDCYGNSTEGQLVNHIVSARIAPYADFVGDKNSVSWLPTAAVAQEWLRITLNGVTPDTTVKIIEPIPPKEFHPTAAGQTMTLQIRAQIAMGASIKSVVFRAIGNSTTVLDSVTQAPWQGTWVRTAVATSADSSYQHFNLYATATDNNNGKHYSPWVPVDYFMPVRGATAVTTSAAGLINGPRGKVALTRHSLAISANGSYDIRLVSIAGHTIARLCGFGSSSMALPPTCRSLIMMGTIDGRSVSAPVVNAPGR